MRNPVSKKAIAALVAVCVLAVAGAHLALIGLIIPHQADQEAQQRIEASEAEGDLPEAHDTMMPPTGSDDSAFPTKRQTINVAPDNDSDQTASADELRATLNLSEDYRASFVHGDKGAEHQKYIMLHDTEGDGDAASVISYWDGNGAGVAAHFVINKDGSIVQCVPLDKITHHAGFGDTGHNALYGTEDESRDDKVGTTPIGDWAADYGMNSYSIGIEMVHVGGSGPYPEAQLEALDNLIAYIDAYYGFESEIIDHKAWRSGNSDTSAEFAEHLDSYQTRRTHA